MDNTSNKIMESIFIQYGTLKSYPANHIVTQKGDPAEIIAYIKSGSVRSMITNPDGDETTLFYLSKDHVFGLDSLVPNYTVVVSVQTISPCELYILTAKQFLEIWQAHNYPLQELFSCYLSRVTLLSDYVCCSHFTNAKQKIAYFLHSSIMYHGSCIALTNEQIAAVTGIKRISVNRILNSFAKDGIVKLEYKKIIILDEDKLVDIFNGLGYFLN